MYDCFKKDVTCLMCVKGKLCVRGLVKRYPGHLHFHFDIDTNITFGSHPIATYFTAKLIIVNPVINTKVFFSNSNTMLEKFSTKVTTDQLP